MGLFNWLSEIENCMEMLFEGLFPGLTSLKRLMRSTIPSGIVITKFRYLGVRRSIIRTSSVRLQLG